MQMQISKDEYTAIFFNYFYTFYNFILTFRNRKLIMESVINEVEITTLGETRENTESQDNIVAAKSNFHNYGLCLTKNASETMPANNAIIPNVDLSSNTDLYKSIIFKVGESYICPECKETFYYLRNLKRHVQKKHSSLLSILFPSVKSGLSYKCNVCKETFFYLMDFKRHVKSKHSSLSSTVVPTAKTNASHKCPICREFLTYRQNLKRHVRNKHPDSFSALFPSVKPNARPSASFECDACKGTFSHLCNLKRHVMTMHPTLLSTLYTSIKSSASHKRNISEKYAKTSFQSDGCDSQQIYCKKHNCPLCPETLGITKFNEHFEKSHNLMLKPVQLNFGSYTDFCTWKKAIERATKSYFAKYSFRESKGIAQHKFICHRSGTFKPGANAKKKLKARGSRKINAYCPAAIKIFIDKEGKCEVLFQSQHLGHENDLEHLSLTHEERKYVADKLATNLPLDDILNDIRSSASLIGAERLCRITRKDLHNIKRSYLKNNLFDSSAAKMDEKLTKDLSDIHNKHTESEHIKADITKIDKGWVLTFTEQNEIYLIKENSKSCDCPLVCVYCRVCIKSYSCSCSDSSIEGNMCKHIHFFCMERNIPDINDSSVCDNNDEISFSKTDECGANSNIYAHKKLPNRDENIFIDSEKRNILKNKFSDLVDILITEEEYKLFEVAIEEITEKLKSMQIQSIDTVNNTVIPATNRPVEIVNIGESTQDQCNEISANNHSVEIACVDKNMQVQQSSVPATSHSFEIVHDSANTQDHNSVPVVNHPFEMMHFNKSTQDRPYSYSQKSTPKSLIMEMLNPQEQDGAKICYIHFAKAKTK